MILGGVQLSKIQNLRDVPVGTKIELSVTDTIEGKLNIGFVSQIEDYIDESVIRISAPIHEAKVYPVKLNSYIEGYLFLKSNQIYRMVGYVQNRLIIDDIAFLDIVVTEKLRKIQRRQFFRFTCSVPVTFFIQNQNKPGEELKKISGNTIDLSGGGLSALTNEPLENDIQLKGTLVLDDTNYIDFSAKVIRCTENILKEEKKYVSSIGFIDIDYIDREKVVAFIFDQQRLLLKKS
jgi:c-di-GMP-binding flagellar brake protein YcgR